MSEIRHYLFVCHANMDRSPTAEAVCNRMAREHNLPIEASSAGVSPGANRPITKEIAEQADKIFVMEERMKDEIVDTYGQDPAKVVCFDIADAYFQNDPVLVQRLEKKLRTHLTEEGLI